MLADSLAVMVSSYSPPRKRDMERCAPVTPVRFGFGGVAFEMRPHASVRWVLP